MISSASAYSSTSDQVSGGSFEQHRHVGLVRNAVDRLAGGALVPGPIIELIAGDAIARRPLGQVHINAIVTVARQGWAVRHDHVGHARAGGHSGDVGRPQVAKRLHGIDHSDVWQHLLADGGHALNGVAPHGRSPEVPQLDLARHVGVEHGARPNFGDGRDLHDRSLLDDLRLNHDGRLLDDLGLHHHRGHFNRLGRGRGAGGEAKGGNEQPRGRPP
jgi:hypothetical protein